jgi:hypothetical protein
MENKKDIISKEIERIEREILSSHITTETKKNNFAKEIKTTLGPKIKQNPNKVKIIKKPLRHRLKDFLIKLFTKL